MSGNRYRNTNANESTNTNTTTNLNTDTNENTDFCHGLKQHSDGWEARVPRAAPPLSGNCLDLSGLVWTCLAESGLVWHCFDLSGDAERHERGGPGHRLIDRLGTKKWQKQNLETFNCRQGHTRTVSLNHVQRPQYKWACTLFWLISLMHKKLYRNVIFSIVGNLALNNYHGHFST